jgi:cytochrome c553
LSDQDMADLGEYYAAQTASSPNNPLKWYLETCLWNSD